MLRTFEQLLRRPGTLTTAYVDGQRKPFTPPFQLFLIANVFFFAVQSLAGLNVLGASLDSHLHMQDWQALAQTLLDQRLQDRHTTLALYEPAFDRAVVLNARSLVILMAMAFAPVLALVFIGRRHPFMAHVAFALHVFTFLMLLFSFAVLVAQIDVWLGGEGLRSKAIDNVLSAFNFVASGAYLYAALGPAYGVDGAGRVVRALALAVAAPALVLGYRFAIFVITLYTT